MTTVEGSQAVASSKPTLYLIHGPNLNLLGTREPQKYGKTTLKELETLIKDHGAPSNIQVETFQSNHEGAILDFIHTAANQSHVKGIIINAGAYTHTSVAIRDALLGVNVPFIEVHITNVHARESFRHHSYLSDKATAVICGLGTRGYLAAVDFFAEKIETEKTSSI